ncbi:Rac GTPase-activating protein 1 [Microtus ochrogaster]|uniref:Rac GTPase-activating protein 1 n=1 Tax=Microtus ochrogaster TaxID=79684 RepID=A0A8J6GH13_MICOH|nr:Rac GTPase-activating protein 1 [Microtus ochrogaster]
MDTTMVNLWTLFEQLVRRLEIINEGNESIEFIQVVKDFEDFRKKCQRTNQELEKFKDLLLKAETGRSALDVKLKHARNQVDVEIKRRQRAEAECAKLEQQIQLIRDILMCDTSGSIQLSEEQKSALAFLNRGQAPSGNSGNNRLSTIDESGSILSDISFDKTDESLRSNSRQFIDGPPGPVKKTCSIGSTVDQGMLADFVSQTSPMIPAIIVSCVNEIEQRGLTEAGLYRISGCDRTVKELKEKFLKVKTVPLLSKVDDIHAICSLLKDFLRNLKEPLLTSWLSRAFMEAAEITDEDNSTAAMYQAVSELPQANRDTLAFLMIHLQRVAQSPDTKMDIANLAKVFGPTIVAHTVPNPDPVTMFQDIKRQLKVVERLLSLPLEYWNQFMMVEQENIDIQRGNGNSTPRTPDIKGHKTPWGFEIRKMAEEDQLGEVDSSRYQRYRSMQKTMDADAGSRATAAVVPVPPIALPLQCFGSPSLLQPS